MKIRYYIATMIMAVLPFILMGQETESHSDNNTGLINSGFSTNLNTTGFSAAKYNTTAGMNFGMFNGGNYIQSFINPALTMPLNKKFSVSAGLSYSHTRLNNYPIINSEGEFGRTSTDINTVTIFTSGAYKANERLTFTGSAYKTINPAFNERLNPAAIRMEAQGVSFGVGYKISEKMHIGAEIRMHEGNYNYNEPFNRYPGSSFGNSIFNNPFNSPFGY